MTHPTDTNVRYMQGKPFNAVQQAVLDDLNQKAEWRCSDGMGWQDIAFETTTGDHLIYINDQHAAAALRPDGSLDWEAGAWVDG